MAIEVRERDNATNRYKSGRRRDQQVYFQSREGAREVPIRGRDDQGILCVRRDQGMQARLQDLGGKGAVQGGPKANWKDTR